jgi:hypothetical protein
MMATWPNFAALDAYDRVTFRGHQFNARDVAMIYKAEKDFGSAVPIMQGSFRGDVEASGNTHDGGGAADWSLSGMSLKRKTRWARCLKDAAWCYWRRLPTQGPWPEHGHGVARGCRNLAYNAQMQVGAFDRKEDGLVGDGMDYSYRPDPIATFSYTEFRKRWIARNQIARIRDRIAEDWREIKATRRKIIARREEIARIKKGLTNHH